MLKWIRSAFAPKNRFTIPELQNRLPACCIRVYRENDFEACAEIFRAHEGTHFPHGVFDDFARLHKSVDVRPLILIAQSEGELRAFGGITILTGQRFAYLTFGMVHPEHQRSGYGSALLLARLAALPKPLFDWKLVLSTAGPSASFYARFGFRHTSRYTHPLGLELDQYVARLDLRGWTDCFKRLWEAPIRIEWEGMSVPERDLIYFYESES